MTNQRQPLPWSKHVTMTFDRLTDQDIIRQTKKWVVDVVIGLNFCPFAAKPYHAGRIRYKVLRAPGLRPLLEACMEEARLLDQNQEIETTLLILPPVDFEGFLDNLELCEALLCDQGYEGVYQLASFHPAYQFDGTGEEDPGNFTNRSPYPMLHFLRESSISHAVDTYPEVNEIPGRNRKRAREMGVQSMATLRQACLEMPVRDSE